MVDAFCFKSLPSVIDYRLFLDSMGGYNFMLYHDLSSCKTYLILDGNEDLLLSSVVGMELTKVNLPELNSNDFTCLITYNKLVESIDRNVSYNQSLSDLYDIFKGTNAGLFITFCAANGGYANKLKSVIEQKISSSEIRATKSLRDKVFDHDSSSTQVELYYDSDERNALTSILEMLNEISLANGTCYKVGIAIVDDSKRIERYLESKLLILERKHLNANTIETLYKKMNQMDALPFSYTNAACMLSFSTRINRGVIIKSQRTESYGTINVGNYLEGSVRITNEKIAMAPDVFNLGTLITGVPGTGKTSAAMLLTKQLIETSEKMSLIISPTDEWDSFGLANNMKIVRLYESSDKLNLFKCSASINIERFYENLAMLIASASGAGPYTNSVEKCLLSAFSKMYSKTREPDPIEMYEEIEEAVIEQHGKRIGSSVKYTKHGENIKAALQNLRLMLMKPEFAYCEGVDFRDLLKEGVVIDLSKVSNSMKPFFYAFILNQAYSFADEFDVRGDEDLRMLICLEEAQLVFGKDEESAATIDLEQRIQDFRKRGVGLIMITHNVVDLSPRIRRLMQIKMYFRQSSDVAKYAAADLMFDEEYSETVINKLKTMSQQVCALNYIVKTNEGKSPGSTIFIKTDVIKIPDLIYENRSAQDMLDSVSLKLMDSLNLPKQGLRVQGFYVGERIFDGRSDEKGFAIINRALKGRKYKFLIGERKKDQKEITVMGGESISVSV